MLRILLEKELRDIAYSTKFAITFAAAAVLVILSFYVGIRNYQESVQEYEADRAADVSNVSSLTDWRQVSHKVFRKPQPLQVLLVADAETLLLIYYDKSQVLEAYILREQPVRPYYDVDGAVGNTLYHPGLLGGGPEP